MANVRTLQKAFSGGEVTPEFYGRIDDQKYQTGLATCRNFIVLPHGPISNRAGTEFVRAAKVAAKKARMIPFTYSTTQTMALEFGDGYIRFHTQGATLLAGTPTAYNGATAYVVGDLCSSAGVNYYCIAASTGNAPPNVTYWYPLPSTAYEIPSPYLEADLFAIHYVQSADVLTLVHPGYAPRELRRLGATQWVLSTIAFTASVSAPSAPSLTSSGSTAGKYNYEYIITSLASDGVTESVSSTPAIGPGVAISGITNANPGVITTGAAHGLSVNDPVYIAAVGGMTQLNGNHYLVDSVPLATTLTLRSTAGVVVDTTAFGVYTAGGSIYPKFIRSNLFETGCTNTITWSSVSGASRYNVYKMQGGLYGYIGQTSGTSIVDDNIAPDLGKTPPIYETVFGGTGEYPGAVSYFEQRRCFAGSTNKPQNMWMTRSGTESGMSYSLPIRDDDRISFRVAAREANTIRHIVPLSNLVLLTSAAEWMATSINSDAITPTSVAVKPQSYIGASNTQPLIVNNTMIYEAARGGHIRELGYNWQASGYVTGDLSIRAPHLFDRHTIDDMAFSKSPYPIAWFVRDDGALLGLTYMPEQQIGAWHQHDTDGEFESVCVVSEGNDDVAYFVVKRTINGATVRYIERMGGRWFSDQEDAYFVDCGLTYSGAAATTITGLDHLEGETVSILGDGAVHPQQVVTGGEITLEQAVTLAHIGLPIVSDAVTLPLALEIAGYGQGRTKNVNQVFMRVFDSSGAMIGPYGGRLIAYKQRTTEPYGSPPDLATREIQVSVAPSWGDSAQIHVRQADPLPITIVGLSMEVAIGA